MDNADLVTYMLGFKQKKNPKLRFSNSPQTTEWLD